MKQYKGLPLFEVVFSDEDSVFNNVAFVTAPAIEENFIRLSKQEDNEIKLSVDDEKRIVSGPALIPDMPIYRDQGGRRFYITWTAETIKQMAISFFRNSRQNAGNVEHQVPVNGITYFESYIIDKERGICPKEYENLPDGTWMLSAKVTNDEVWDLVKEGSLTGFSIDVSNVQFKEEKEIDTLEELLEYLNNNN